MGIKLGVPQEIVLSNRYYEQNRDFAIRDIFDVIVELITNSDDSYHHLFVQQKRSEDGGPILIEIEEHRKDKPSILRVKDKAEGMTLDDMIKKIKVIGEKTSELGDRGFMSRGLKDCTALGDLQVESIVNEKYFKWLMEIKKA